MKCSNTVGRCAFYVDALDKKFVKTKAACSVYKEFAAPLMKLGENPYNTANMQTLYELAQKFDSAKEVLEGAKITRRIMAHREWFYPVLDQLITRLRARKV